MSKEKVRRVTFNFEINENGNTRSWYSAHEFTGLELLGIIELLKISITTNEITNRSTKKPQKAARKVGKQ